MSGQTHAPPPSSDSPVFNALVDFVTWIHDGVLVPLLSGVVSHGLIDYLTVFLALFLLSLPFCLCLAYVLVQAFGPWLTAKRQAEVGR